MEGDFVAELALDDIVASWREGFLPRQPKTPHHGCEFEYQVMNRKNPGEPFDFVGLLPEFSKLGSDWHLKLDTATGEPDGVWHKGVFITRDAARSMVEIVLPPHTRLEDTERDLEILNAVRKMCWKNGGVLLPYGTHPYMKRGVWFPGRRYRLLQEVLGDSIHYVTRGTASQVHIEVGKAQVLHLMNTLNALSGVMVILFANSPIDNGGHFSGHLSRRQSFYGSFAPDRGGMPPQPLKSPEAYVEQMVERTFLLGWRDGRYGIPQMRGKKLVFSEHLFGRPMTFRAFLEQQGDREAQVEAFLEQEPYHAATHWDNVRPRRAFSTVESRPADAQPFEDTMTVPALNVGLATNLSEAARIVKSASWGDWVQLHNDAIRLGFSSYFGGAQVDAEDGIVATVLACAQRGLEMRGLGEERYLAPLFKRLQRGKNPADIAFAKFRKGEDEFLRYLMRYEQQ